MSPSVGEACPVYTRETPAEAMLHQQPPTKCKPEVSPIDFLGEYYDIEMNNDVGTGKGSFPT